MARKEKIIDIQDRDQTLTFKIREMPASKLESWMMRAFLALAGNGVELPDDGDISEAGQFLSQNALAQLSKVDFNKAEPLLNELLACCSRVVENVEERCTPATVDNYIQDAATLFLLRVEALTLNLGFSVPEGESVSGFLKKHASATL